MSDHTGHAHSYYAHEDVHRDEGENGYWDNAPPRDTRDESTFGPRPQDTGSKSRSDTIRKVVVAAGLAGVVLGVLHLWKAKEQAEHERRRRRKRQDFARAKDARRRREREEEDREDGPEPADDRRGRHNLRIGYPSGGLSKSKSRRVDSKDIPDTDDDDPKWSPDLRTRERDYDGGRRAR